MCLTFFVVYIPVIRAWGLLFCAPHAKIALKPAHSALILFVQGLTYLGFLITSTVFGQCQIQAQAASPLLYRRYWIGGKVCSSFAGQTVISSLELSIAITIQSSQIELLLPKSVFK